MHHLIVSRAFGDHARGDRIEDQDEVERVLASEHEHHVVRIAVPDEPSGSPAPPPAQE